MNDLIRQLRNALSVIADNVEESAKDSFGHPDSPFEESFRIEDEEGYKAWTIARQAIAAADNHLPPKGWLDPEVVKRGRYVEVLLRNGLVRKAVRVDDYWYNADSHLWGEPHIISPESNQIRGWRPLEVKDGK